MYPDPAGSELTGDECRALDDHYLTSDPTSYFRSRIDSLLDWVDQPTPAGAAPSEVRRRFEGLVGPVASSRFPTSNDQRQAQVAIDAIQLRHATAEALLRLLHAKVTCRSAVQPASLWMALIQTPAQLHKLVEELRPHVESADFFPVLAGMLIPAPLGTKLDETSGGAVNTALEWIARASEIVSTGHIDLNAANNKIKHGVTARLEDKMRLTMTLEPFPDDGRVPLSALTGKTALTIFDTTVVEYISRPPKTDGKEPHGFERTLLRVDAPSVLAEAWMLALVHGGIFYTSAYRHRHEGWEPSDTQHPGLAVGPSPEQVMGRNVVGMRFPVTKSPSGESHRPAGILFGDGTFRTLTFGPGRRGIVTDG